MVEIPGGGRLNRPGLKLGCRAKEDDDKEERKKGRKKNLGKGTRSPVETHSYLHNQLG